MRNADWTTSVSVLDRVTAIFEAFDEHGEGLGVSELARRANLPKSTVSRIAADLVGQRFLDRDDGKLYLGIRLFELGLTVSKPRKLREAALPLMNELRMATGRSVQLAVLEQTDVVLVAVIRGKRALTTLGPVGSRRPAHSTAAGKALLAFSAREVVEDVVHGGLERLTANTICEPAKLAGELTTIRKTRIAIEREECASDLVSVASPVLGYGTTPVAAIAVAGCADEMNIDHLAPTVRAAAVALSHRIGNG
ncbi:IclR family transcriptional regulator [Mycetocola zhadangensis]|uniref:IclR family transcriptional regulator n=1 Tax=Mycetocola zhadangensis TaxID=1164595 RepID=A0A3L7ISD3_9MICO|nr:IclR family transcriptional regulator [Mycetocola zhadangensis]RLQ81144.1 IclR family transcriptional regulator [Mycetocola zhadangensis]GGF05161.1 IclR family transcriptional regulator [Mycetocola zhadangensis]